jgi:hypothetical protein
MRGRAAQVMASSLQCPPCHSWPPSPACDHSCPQAQVKPDAEADAAAAAAAAEGAYEGDDERDPETFDDTEFYQTLLKEFLEGSGAASDGNWFSVRPRQCPR